MQHALHKVTKHYVAARAHRTWILVPMTEKAENVVRQFFADHIPRQWNIRQCHPFVDAQVMVQLANFFAPTELLTTRHETHRAVATTNSTFAVGLGHPHAIWPSRVPRFTSNLLRGYLETPIIEALPKIPRRAWCRTHGREMFAYRAPKQFQEPAYVLHPPLG